MPFCTQCGHENPAGSKFCGQCGAPIPTPSATEGKSTTETGETTSTLPAIGGERDLESLTAEEEAAVKALPHGSALLIVQGGSNAGSRFLLNSDSVAVGRHEQSDIFLDDISVSRQHATFLRTSEGTVVRDHGSLNGTYVNRELRDEALLHDSDEVQIGKFRLIYYASAEGVE